MKNFASRVIPYILYVIVAAVPILVAPGSYYPFTLPKAVFFFVAVDLMFILSLFSGHFNLQRLKELLKEPLTQAFLFFILISILTSLTGINPIRSFIGTPVRMTGAIANMHFFIFYLLFRLHFSSPRNFFPLFKLTIASSIVVALVGFLQIMFPGQIFDFRLTGSLVGTMGNQGFVAQFLLLHVFLLVYLYKEHQLPFGNSKKIFWLMFVILSFVIFLCANRGVILAFLFGWAVFVACWIFEKKSLIKTKISSFIMNSGRNSVFIVLILSIAIMAAVKIFPSLPDTLFTRNIRQAVTFSFENPTVQTRFILQKISWNAFLEKPFFGVGPENFEYVFHKYYDPKFMKFGATETWFDRSHNMLLQTMVEMGILGTVALLALAIVILKLSYQRSKLLFVLLMAFFASMLIEVESFNSLVVFVMLIGFIGAKEGVESESGKEYFSWRTLVLGSIFAVLSIFFYISSLLGLHLMNRAAIQGIELQWDLQKFLPDFQQGYKLARFSPYFQAVGTKDAVDSFLLIGYEKSTIQVHEDLLQTLTNNIEKALQWFPEDLRFIYSLGRLYGEWGNADPKYYAKAESLLQRGYAINPKKQVFLIALGELVLRRAGKNTHGLQLKKGLDYFYDAIAVEDQAPVPHWLLGKAMLQYGLKDGAEREFTTATGLGIKFMRVSEPLSIIAFLAEKNAYKTIQYLYQEVVRLQPEVGLFHARLATSYLMNGDKENARKEAEKAIEFDQSLKKGYDEMMEKLN